MDRNIDLQTIISLYKDSYGEQSHELILHKGLVIGLEKDLQELRAEVERLKGQLQPTVDDESGD